MELKQIILMLQKEVSRMELEHKIQSCAKGFAVVCIIAFGIKAIVNFSIAGGIGNVSSGYFRIDGLANAFVFFGIADLILGIGAAICFYYPVLGISRICKDQQPSTTQEPTPMQNPVNAKTESDSYNTTDAIMFCSSCGTKLTQQTGYCHHCGAKVS